MITQEVLLEELVSEYAQYHIFAAHLLDCHAKYVQYSMVDLITDV
jgi:hypothetical protein